MTSHLDDAAFAELWTNALAEGHEPALDPHLQACAECRVRFASFSQWMIDVRSDAAADAADALSPERLASQQAQIFRRLEAAERPARVIAFPKHFTGTMRRSPAHRWVTAAAAAALIAGFGLGQVFDLRHWAANGPQVARNELNTAPPSPSAPARPHAVPAVAIVNEEAAFADLEAAATPRYEALRAYDTFTPRAADFVQPR